MLRRCEDGNLELKREGSEPGRDVLMFWVRVGREDWRRSGVKRGGEREEDRRWRREEGEERASLIVGGQGRRCVES